MNLRPYCRQREFSHFSSSVIFKGGPGQKQFISATFATSAIGEVALRVALLICILRY